MKVVAHILTGMLVATVLGPLVYGAYLLHPGLGWIAFGIMAALGIRRFVEEHENRQREALQSRDRATIEREELERMMRRKP